MVLQVMFIFNTRVKLAHYTLNKGISIATDVCIDTSGCSGQVTIETLYLNLNIKGSMAVKLAILQGY